MRRAKVPEHAACGHSLRLSNEKRRLCKVFNKTRPNFVCSWSQSDKAGIGHSTFGLRSDFAHHSNRRAGADKKVAVLQTKVVPLFCYLFRIEIVTAVERRRASLDTAQAE